MEGIKDLYEQAKKGNSEALKQLQSQAEQGDAVAQYVYGMLLDEGFLVRLVILLQL
ncbi:MAG: hypothetical protein RMM17_09935 [Acidobacteriota bacterium]|nr:hypothetical protein [Blastocatellia bacterium]MDW8412988.1 hypothetical protein [Acidobacteriota bacterium]